MLHVSGRDSSKYGKTAELLLPTRIIDHYFSQVLTIWRLTATIWVVPRS